MGLLLVFLALVVILTAADKAVQSALKSSLRDFAQWRQMVRRHIAGPGL